MTTTQRDVLVHNAKIFEGKDGQSTTFARLTVNSSDSSLLLSRTFWPRALHCRRWYFKEQEPQKGTQQLQEEEEEEELAIKQRAEQLLRDALKEHSQSPSTFSLQMSPDSDWAQEEAENGQTSIDESDGNTSSEEPQLEATSPTGDGTTREQRHKRCRNGDSPASAPPAKR